MVQTITLGAGSAAQTSVSLVTLPPRPSLRAIEPGAFDAISSLRGWNGNTQTQLWPGGESWTAKCTLPPLRGTDIDAWEAWLLQMRGMLCAVQLGFPNKKEPRGAASGTPYTNHVNSSTDNSAMATYLITSGWTPNVNFQLMPNDALQIGYRYYRVLDAVGSDPTGNAAIPIWPSLREAPPDGTPVILHNPKALWRFPRNQRNWSLRLPMVMDLSFDLTEFR